VVNDILDFSKIESGRLDLENISFDLESTIEDTVELLSFKAHQKGLEYLFWVDPDVPVQVRGDPMKLSQIILNLLNNAVKFTEQGSITLRVSLADNLNEQIKIRFSLEDTGIGISNNSLSILFKSFSQVDSRTTRKYGGTGLGLAIAKEAKDNNRICSPEMVKDLEKGFEYFVFAAMSSFDEGNRIHIPQ
jgi:two-component system, sensor histidine kinase and response regulator